MTDKRRSAERLQRFAKLPRRRTALKPQTHLLVRAEGCAQTRRLSRNPWPRSQRRCASASAPPSEAAASSIYARYQWATNSRRPGGVHDAQGIAATTVEECVESRGTIEGRRSRHQVPDFGGREEGLGAFRERLPRGRSCDPQERDSKNSPKKMIGQTLVTKQSGPEGKPVNTRS